MKKTVLITGSSRGIGLATAQLFGENGWRVIGVDRTDGRTHADLFIRADLAYADAVNSIKIFFKKNKIERLDGLVNNAALQTVKSFENITRAEWQQSFTVNASAPFFLSQALLPELRKARGSIVNVASIHARLTKRYFSLYAATKGALVTLTKALAIELAPLVRVNAILPAATETPMLKDGFKNNKKGYKQLGNCHPLQRIAKPKEVAELIYFLAADRAGFITGSTFPIDGGIGACLLDPVA